MVSFIFSIILCGQRDTVQVAFNYYFNNTITPRAGVAEHTYYNQLTICEKDYVNILLIKSYGVIVRIFFAL